MTHSRGPVWGRRGGGLSAGEELGVRRWHMAMPWHAVTQCGGVPLILCITIHAHMYMDQAYLSNIGPGSAAVEYQHSGAALEQLFLESLVGLFQQHGT